VDRERLKVPRQKFRVVDGRPIGEIPTDRIALSFVHPTERIDVPISAIRWIEPPYIRERIYRLTKTIVGEAIEIVIDGKCIIKPVIREPLGVHQSLSISEIYYEDAVALADRLRARWSETGPKLV
jgi:preprotein translocase subunit SecD